MEPIKYLEEISIFHRHLEADNTTELLTSYAKMEHLFKITGDVAYKTTYEYFPIERCPKNPIKLLSPDDFEKKLRGAKNLSLQVNIAERVLTFSAQKWRDVAYLALRIPVHSSRGTVGYSSRNGGEIFLRSRPLSRLVLTDLVSFTLQVFTYRGEKEVFIFVEGELCLLSEILYVEKVAPIIEALSDIVTETRSHRERKMLLDTHRLRRSIIHLLNTSPSKTLSYENITKMFPRSSSGELRTNIYALVRLGFAVATKQTGQDVQFTLIDQEISATNSAVLYGKLEVSATYTYTDLFETGGHLGFTRGGCISAIQSLINDEAIRKVSRGRYIALELPKIFQTRLAAIYPDQNIEIVCPLRRAIWTHLPHVATKLAPFEELIIAISPEFNRMRFSKAILSMEAQGSIFLSQRKIRKGERYFPFPEDIIYAHIKDLDEVTFEEIKSVSNKSLPQNVISTLMRQRAIERISAGRYRVLSLPQCLFLSDPTEEPTQDEVTVTTEWAVEVAQALADADSAKTIYESLRGEAHLKIEQVTQLRSKADALNRRASSIEASYKQPLDEAEQKAMEARENLSNILKENGLI